MATSIFTIRVQGADGRIVPASFKASSRTAAEKMALARGYDVLVDSADEAAAEDQPDSPSAAADAQAQDEPYVVRRSWWPWLRSRFASGRR